MERKTYRETLIEKILGTKPEGKGRVNVDFGVDIAAIIPETKMPKQDQINFGIAMFHVLIGIMRYEKRYQDKKIVIDAIKDLLHRKNIGMENQVILFEEFEEIIKHGMVSQRRRVLDYLKENL